MQRQQHDHVATVMRQAGLFLGSDWNLENAALLHRFPTG
jgi:hypothetical protein